MNDKGARNRKRESPPVYPPSLSLFLPSILSYSLRLLLASLVGVNIIINMPSINVCIDALEKTQERKTN